MSTFFKQFKAAYLSYAIFWEQWKLYNDNGLTAFEIYVLEIHIKNDFTVMPENDFMFYNQAKLIEEITEKLNYNFVKYQDWVMQKFVSQFIKLVGFPDFEIKCAVPIVLLELDDKIKDILAQLNVNSVLRFFELQGKDKWRDSENFYRLQIVVVALAEMSVSGKITNSKKPQHE